MMQTQAPIAIIGAGPAGLTLARLLEVAEIPYVVFERDVSANWANEHQSSGTLDLHPNTGQAALLEAGLLPKFQSLARYGVPITIADAQGKIHSFLSREGDEDEPEIDRKDLRDLLLSSLPPSKILWDHKIQRIEKENNGSVTIYFTHQDPKSGFRLVVGADGAWSKVRSTIISSKPQYSGIHFFSSFIKPENPIYPLAASKAGTGSFLAFGKERQIFLYYLGDGSYHVSVGLKISEKNIPDESILASASTLWDTFLQEYFTGWASDLTKFVRSCDGKFRSWPLYTMTEDAILSWDHVPRVTLVGDAVHLTVPTGDGVNNAMHDSVNLARHIILLGVNDLESATLAYEKEMRPRAVAAIQKGHWMTRHMFLAKGPEEILAAMGTDD
ncbi:hypothetical protein N7509_009881 [Penicillium cosmopolitanum]|uniref:FAD-binding domain-containing protein n=1 Tax=Penicillium cosmopolitanum TaxID=1131564 RepID=A0A9W9VQF8_9EURO|nr:uncharacterized protein N7509_009881 [Penicillium cosmopolitanum]KAJ5387340.1 hypothetical protein N7509_009881 [Penicillium cosmopolitanum]